jgi:hypothetical protein
MRSRERLQELKSLRGFQLDVMSCKSEQRHNETEKYTIYYQGFAITQEERGTFTQCGEDALTSYSSHGRQRARRLHYLAGAGKKMGRTWRGAVKK